MNTLIAGRIHYQQVEFATNQPQISYPLFLCYQETGAQAHISREIIVSRMQSPMAQTHIVPNTKIWHTKYGCKTR